MNWMLGVCSGEGVLYCKPDILYILYIISRPFIRTRSWVTGVEHIILHDTVCEVSLIFYPQIPSSSSLIFLVGQQFIKNIALITVESKEKGELFSW